MLEAAERIEQGLPISATLADFVGSAPGAGGARSKVSVRDATGLLWLAKFAAAGDTFDVAWAECCTLKLALRCGLSVPQVEVLGEELFARMVFNIFASNDDDDLRNHGFVRDPRLPGWRLSPLYDVVPRPNVALKRQLHLHGGSQGKLATLDNPMSTHSAVTPQRATAIAIIGRIWSELRQWRTAFEDMGASSHLIDQLASALRDLDEVASATLQADIRKLDV